MAKRLEIEIIEVLQESKSAKSPGRPVFNTLMQKIALGEASGVLCWKLDRLARNAVDGGAIIWAIKQHGIEIITPAQIYSQDSENAFMMYVEFGMAQKFVDDLSKNVKRGLKAKAEKGWLPSGAKPGYMNDKYAEKGNKTTPPDPVRFPLIRRAWDLMLTGTYNVPKILEILNEEWGYRTPKHKRIGGKPICRSMLYFVFSDSFYYGEFEYPRGSGIWYKGKHKPMITLEEYDRVQQLLGRKGRPRPKSIDFDYSGLLLCGNCGGAVTAEEKRQIICSACKTKFSSKNKDACIKCGTRIEEMVEPTLLHYIYYHCTKRKNPQCAQKSIRVEDLELQINELLSKIQISERFKAWAIKHLNELNDSETENRNAAYSSLNEVYKGCVQRIDNLVRLKISSQNTDGSLLSDEEFKQQKNILLREKSVLEEKIRSTEDRIGKWIELSEETFNLACHARYWFENGTVQEKRELLVSLGSNLTLKDKTLHVDLQKPLYFLIEAKEKVEEISPMFEPTKKGFDEAQMDNYFSENPTLLRG